MKSLFTKLITLSLATAMSSICVSCNTINGLGKDFQNMGTGLEKTSNYRIGGSKAAAQDIPGYTEDPYLLPAQ